MKRFFILLGLTASTALILGASYGRINRQVQPTSSFHAPTTQSSVHDTTKLKSKRYYGLTANEILALKRNIPEAKKFITRKGISIGAFLTECGRAEIDSVELELVRDSIYIVEGYKRIERKLGIETK